MNLSFPIEEAVKTRSSVRTYEDRPLSFEVKEQINAYIGTLSNPFSVDVSFRLLESKSTANGEKLGTYGVIKGAKDFIGATVPEGEFALEALGYTFEKLILYAASLGLGTCWLGGTFKRSEFAKAMDVKSNELFPAISPIGYPFGKKRLIETLARRVAKADMRKDWSELFFKHDFSHPLTQADAAEYAFPLEMLRLAPSAVNKQPWRIIQTENADHFYKTKVPENSRASFDIQKVDIGIAACHFHLAALEKGLSGSFEKLSTPDIRTPENEQYIFSWIIK
ncbi:MAG: nitroreductase family protein [Oscillospiraceae bacterium]|nr:nitroreductase family protein [Oscillospiraceae bacterium]